MAKKSKKPPPPPPPPPKPVHERGAEYQAEKLMGARAQRGILPTGKPRYVYEVKWAGIDPKNKRPWPNSYEPAACLIGWEAQMKAVDAAIEAQQNAPQQSDGSTRGGCQSQGGGAQKEVAAAAAAPGQATRARRRRR